MKRISIILLLMLVLTNWTWAMFEDYDPSPRARGMGGAWYSIADDAEATFYNPAGLVFTGHQLRIGYAQLQGLDYLENKTLAFTYGLPDSWGGIGLGIRAFDTSWDDEDLYSEKVYTLSHGFTLMKDIHSELHIGYGLSMYHLEIQDYGDEACFGIDVGLLAVLHQRFRVAASVTNINRPTLGEAREHELPQRLVCGVAYEPYPGVLTVLEMKKNYNAATDSDDSPTEIHAGVEVELLDVLRLRMGIGSEPVTYAAGLGVDVHGIMVDYAYQSHEVLDGTHQIGIGYRF